MDEVAGEQKNKKVDHWIAALPSLWPKSGRLLADSWPTPVRLLAGRTASFTALKQSGGYK